jgi:hypothetical protein
MNYHEKIYEASSTEFLIQIANQYARQNDFHRLVKLVKETHFILKDHRDKLDPLVKMALDHYLK